MAVVLIAAAAALAWAVPDPAGAATASAPMSAVQVYDLMVFDQPAAGREAEYLHWYDHDRIPSAALIPGVVSVQRFVATTGDPMQHPPTRYLTLYSLATRDLPGVLKAIGRAPSAPGLIDLKSNLTYVYKALGPQIAGAGSKRFGTGSPATFLFFVRNGPYPGRDDEFNAWYDQHHVLDVIGSAGFVSAQRFVLADPAPAGPALPRYIVSYKIVTDDLAAAKDGLGKRAGSFVGSPAHDPKTSVHFTYTPLTAAVVADGKATLRVGETFRDCRDCPEMTIVPTGAGVVGAPFSEREQEGVLSNAAREGPRHSVSIDRPFALGRAEVTRGLYARFAAETGLTGGPDCTAGGIQAEAAADASKPPTHTWKNPGFAQGDDEPVACVSWNDAKAFVAWLSKTTGKPYRLPSEAEWEYAARAGATTARYWGDSVKPICQYANVLTLKTVQARGGGANDELVCNSDHQFTTVAGSFAGNPFGLLDMLGNVWEPVEDCFHPTYSGAPADGSAWAEAGCKQRITRGGSYGAANWLTRAAARGVVSADHRGLDSGLRVARDLTH